MLLLSPTPSAISRATIRFRLILLTPAALLRYLFFERCCLMPPVSLISAILRLMPHADTPSLSRHYFIYATTLPLLFDYYFTP